MERARVDGLIAEDGPRGAVRFFDEITETGNFGYAPLGTAAKGKTIFDAAVVDMVQEVKRFGGDAPYLGLP
jgi:creatinine amidohydrolase/Fe(II)-dependent formamide hydrolase-like protein